MAVPPAYDPRLVRPILKLAWDAEHDADTRNLRQRREDVADFADPAFQLEVDALLHTFRSLGRGAGLASAQIGGRYNVFVVSPDRDVRNAYVLANVRVAAEPGATPMPSWEGCFSIPRTLVRQECPSAAVVTARGRDGRLVSARVSNAFLIMVLRHEARHNEGLLMVDGAAEVRRFGTDGEYAAALDEVRRAQAGVGGGAGHDAAALLGAMGLAPERVA